MFHELLIPLHAVGDVRVEQRANLGRSGIEHSGPATALMALGDTTVTLRLEPSASLIIDSEPPARPLGELAITVDDPERFAATLRVRSAVEPQGR